jgi:hypothetical protein
MTSTFNWYYSGACAVATLLRFHKRALILIKDDAGSCLTFVVVGSLTYFPDVHTMLCRFQRSLLYSISWAGIKDSF